MEKIIKKFYLTNYTYTGFETNRTSSHIHIYDIIKRRKFEIPINAATVEELSPHEIKEIEVKLNTTIKKIIEEIK
jgi:hypothetical protein